MSHSKKVAIPTSLLDLMLARQKALDWIRESLRALEMAEDILKPYGTSLMPYEARPRNDYAQSVKDLDDRMWRRAIDLTGFSQIMDETEMRKFEASLSPNVINLSCSPAQGKPPEAASRHGRRAMTRPLPLNQAV
ncbi:TPA: hypothetical protein ACQTYG_006032 [Pseudomonas aeruginosa]